VNIIHSGRCRRHGSARRPVATTPHIPTFPNFCRASQPYPTHSVGAIQILRWEQASSNHSVCKPIQKYEAIIILELQWIFCHAITTGKTFLSTFCIFCHAPRKAVTVLPLGKTRAPQQHYFCQPHACYLSSSATLHAANLSSTTSSLRILDWHAHLVYERAETTRRTKPNIHNLSDLTASSQRPRFKSQCNTRIGGL
jgi:hypothetical protein